MKLGSKVQAVLVLIALSISNQLITGTDVSILNGKRGEWMTDREIREYVKKCPCADKSIDTKHTCKLEFHHRKICPSPECICAKKFGLAESEDKK